MASFMTIVALNCTILWSLPGLDYILYCINTENFWKLFWAKILLNLGLLNNMVTQNQFYSVMTLFDVIKSLKILNLGKICAHPWYTNFIFLCLIRALLGTGTKVFFIIFSYWHWFGFFKSINKHFLQQKHFTLGIWW